MEAGKRYIGTSSRQLMYYAYILENKKGRYYIGSCADIQQRLKRHNQNSVRSTKNRGPFKLIYTEEFTTRTEARKRENQLKGYKNPEYFKGRLKIKRSPSSSLV